MVIRTEDEIWAVDSQENH